jgi:hypothetical protein
VFADEDPTVLGFRGKFHPFYPNVLQGLRWTGSLVGKIRWLENTGLSLLTKTCSEDLLVKFANGGPRNLVDDFDSIWELPLGESQPE